jgi:molybdopterin-guanine dinucleotide biosynthesis protein B
MPNIVSIVGKSNAGKTTLMEKLVSCFTEKGYAIGTVKHAHEGFDIDKKGKDSWRHRKAGAKATLLLSNGSLALLKDESRPTIDTISAYLADMDLILVEGFKRQPVSKIEIFRSAAPHTHPLCLDDPCLVAFVTDSDHKPGVPCFEIDDTEGLAAFIEKRFILN